MIPDPFRGPGQCQQARPPTSPCQDSFIQRVKNKKEYGHYFLAIMFHLKNHPPSGTAFDVIWSANRPPIHPKRPKLVLEPSLFSTLVFHRLLVSFLHIFQFFQLWDFENIAESYIFYSVSCMFGLCCDPSPLLFPLQKKRPIFHSFFLHFFIETR